MSEIEAPDGWVRDEYLAGMGTVGLNTYIELGGAYKCDQCNHFVPMDAGEKCPVCDSQMVGTVIMGQQNVHILHPDGWFDE